MSEDEKITPLRNRLYDSAVTQDARAIGDDLSNAIGFPVGVAMAGEATFVTITAVNIESLDRLCQMLVEAGRQNRHP